jgi:D-arabinose 1-dehydrogenase-like Zn-dependent alcohol dehydrogenase
LTRVLSHPQTNTKPGNTVVISGASGGLGHLGTQYALAIGLRVVAIDSGEEKRKMLEGYGVKDFIDFKDFADEQALIEEVRKVSGGRGPHVRQSLKSRRAWKGWPKLTTCTPRHPSFFRQERLPTTTP